jgi:hypothetical protein
MQSNLKKLRTSVVVILALLGVPQVFGATITPVGGSTASFIGQGSIANVIDGVVDFNSFLQLGHGGLGTFEGPFTVRFDLGGQYQLAGMNLWNNAGSIQNDGEGISAFSLTFLNQALSSIGSFSGNATDTLAQQTFAFSASGVSYIDLTINLNHPENGGARTYVDFHEINFFGTASVPDSVPTALLLVAGVLFGQWVSERRR